jgi:hypothetical protein
MPCAAGSAGANLHAGSQMVGSVQGCRCRSNHCGCTCKHKIMWHGFCINHTVVATIVGYVPHIVCATQQGNFPRCMHDRVSGSIVAARKFSSSAPLATCMLPVVQPTPTWVCTWTCMTLCTANHSSVQHAAASWPACTGRQTSASLLACPPAVPQAHSQAI